MADNRKGANDLEEEYRQAQNQLLAIQAEQSKNLATARANNEADRQQINTVAQAGMVAAQDANFNPATNNILGRYGLQKPRTVSTQGRSVQTTPQNITVNNYYNNTTNYPIPGRELAFKSPQQQNSLASFKSWISGVFSRQNEQAALREREYNKKERSLARDANRVMRKMEEVGKSVGRALDPRRVADNPKNQIMTFLKLFGIYEIVKNWDKILDTVNKIENRISSLIGYDGERLEIRNGTLYKALVHYTGGKEGDTLSESLKGLLTDEKTGIFGLIKQYFNGLIEERKAAVSTVDRPEIVRNKMGLPDIGGTITNIANYLGDILNALVGGASGVKKIAAKNIQRSADEIYDTEREKDKSFYGKYTSGANFAGKVDKSLKGNTDLGDANVTLPYGFGRQTYLDSRIDLDSSGNLNSTHASLAQSGALVTALNDAKKSGNVKTSVVLSGFDRLKTYAKTHNGAVVDEEFLKNYYGGTGIGSERWFKLVAVPKEEKDYSRLGQHPTDISWGDVAGDWYKMKMFPELYEKFRSLGINNYTLKLVPAKDRNDKGLDLGDGYGGIYKFYTLSSNDIDQLVSKFTGNNDTKVDLTNKNFSESMISALNREVIAGRYDRDALSPTHNLDIDQTFKDYEYVQGVHNNLQAEFDENMENAQFKGAWKNIKTGYYERMPHTNSDREFFNAYYGPTVDYLKRNGMSQENAEEFALQLISHWAMETGNGKHMSANFNMGNIHAGKNWKGESVAGTDTVAGKGTARYNTYFRKYRNLDEYLDDSMKLLSNSNYNYINRGENGLSFRNGMGPEDYFEALQVRSKYHWAGKWNGDNWRKNYLGKFRTVRDELAEERARKKTQYVPSPYINQEGKSVPFMWGDGFMYNPATFSSVGSGVLLPTPEDITSGTKSMRTKAGVEEAMKNMPETLNDIRSALIAQGQVSTQYYEDETQLLSEMLAKLGRRKGDNE